MNRSIPRSRRLAHGDATVASSHRRRLRSLLGSGLGGVAGLKSTTHSPTAWAQGAPPVRLVVPFAAGGPTDIGARVIAPFLSELMKRQVLVENKPGATGAIGSEFVARGPADGSMILFGTSTTMGSSPAIFPELPCDAIKDFAPVGVVATADNVLVVHPSLPVSNVREFIAYAKAHPGKVTYGSSGIGSTYHLGSELLAEQGSSGCEFHQWIAFFLPAATPKPVVAKLGADLNQVLALAEVKERFAKLGMTAAPGAAEELAETLKVDIARWTRVVKAANIKPE